MIEGNSESLTKEQKIINIFEKNSPKPLSAEELGEELNTTLNNIHTYISILKRKGQIIHISKKSRKVLSRLKGLKYF